MQHIETSASDAVQTQKILDGLHPTKAYFVRVMPYDNEKNRPRKCKQVLDEFSADYHSIMTNVHDFHLVRFDAEWVEPPLV